MDINTKKRVVIHKKHDMKYFCFLQISEGDEKMKFQELPALYKVVKVTRKMVEIGLAAVRGVRDTGEAKENQINFCREICLIKFKA